MTIFYLDYDNGNDSNDGSSWALAWKTITSGATAARIGPGDIIRIAKSPAPTSLGCTAAWTNNSRTVTLTTAQTANIDMCETAWTANGSGDTTVTRTGVATDGKEGSYCMKLQLDSSPQTSIMQAYYATGTLDLSGYQKISFWIKNSNAIVANNWKVCLCSDVAGATPVDTFYITPIPSTTYWVPLTLTKDGGGNLGNSIQSIAIYTDSVAPAASSNILVDDFIACTTSGLTLQSLISKNSAEQGGSEEWYAIKSINSTTVIIDVDANSKAGAGQGYYGTTETVTTYKRETIKTSLASSANTTVQAVQDNGSAGGGNIQFQGGYDTGTTLQTGETYFDGLNGNGYGIEINSRSYVTINYISVIRYSRGYYVTSANNLTFGTTRANNVVTYGFYLICTNSTFTTTSSINNGNYGICPMSSYNLTFTTINSVNGNVYYGLYLSNASYNNTFTTINSASGNGTHGIYVYGCSSNSFGTITNMNNNGSYGIALSNGSDNNIFDTITTANSNSRAIGVSASCNNKVNTITTSNCSAYAISFDSGSCNNYLKSFSSSGSILAGVYCNGGWNYLKNSTIAESTEVVSVSNTNCRIFSHNHDNTTGNHWIFTDGGTINAQNTTRHTDSGLAWTITPTNTRTSIYPIDFKIAKIACAANALVTVKCWMKKGHATNVGGKLVCRGGQISGVTSDVTTTAADNTDWQELTITFTPTEVGVVEIEAWGYYIAGNSTVTVDDMTISQA